MGDHFTDRTAETHRLKMNFTHGVNSILISPRRMGKTSLVDKVCEELRSNKELLIVKMDIFDCRSEYDFLNRFAASIMQQTASQVEKAIDNVKEFLVRLTPKVVFNPDIVAEYSLQLGITPKEYSPEEILALPQLVAHKRGKEVVVCIDEFQQVGDFPDSLVVQKRMRGVWQHQQDVTYCLFGSKRNMMTKIFQSPKMPFYHFGDTIHLQPIPISDWVPFICQKFTEQNMSISEELASDLCQRVSLVSSYVQHLAWNIMINTEKEVNADILEESFKDLLAQLEPNFMQHIEGLTSYQMNFLKAVAAGIHKDYGSTEMLSRYDFGSKSNITRIRTTLEAKELIEKQPDGIYFADPVFGAWLSRR